MTIVYDNKLKNFVIKPKQYRIDYNYYRNEILNTTPVLENLSKKVPKDQNLIECVINFNSNSKACEKISRPLISQKFSNTNKTLQGMRCYTYFAGKISGNKSKFMAENAEKDITIAYSISVEMSYAILCYNAFREQISLKPILSTKIKQFDCSVTIKKNCSEISFHVRK